MPDNDKAREIREQLDAIAPYPTDGPVTALALARHLAVQCQKRHVRQMEGPRPTDPRDVMVLVTEFAAAHALYALAATQRTGLELDLGVEPAIPQGIVGRSPDDVAAQIRDAWEDGGSIGEWLWEYLGEETCEKVRSLTQELMAALAPEPVTP